jgi:hypothetical protein
MDRGRVLGGATLVVLGGVLLAGQLGLVDAGAVISGWWPLVVVAAGLLRIVDRETTGGLIVTAIGLALLGWRQGLLGADLWQWLAPLLLVALGAALLLRRPRARPAISSGPVGGVTSGTAGPVLDVAAVLSGRQLGAEATPFLGGSAVAVLGSVELDLTAATLGPAGARLDLTSVLGSVELEVPDDWRVRIDGPAILAGIEDRTSPAPQDAPLLVIQAFALLGAIEVTSRAPRRPRQTPAGGATGTTSEPTRTTTHEPTLTTTHEPTRTTTHEPTPTGDATPRREKEPT